MPVRLGRYLRLGGYLRRQWQGLLCIFLVTMLYSGVTALQPWPMKLLVDNALSGAALPEALSAGWIGGGGPAGVIFLAAAASLGLFVLNSALDAALSWTWTVTGQRMVYDLAADLFHRLQRMSILFHRQNPIGDSLSRLTGDTWCVYSAADSILVAPAQHGLTILTVGYVAWKLDPVMAALSLGVAPLLALSSRYFGGRLKQRSADQRKAQARLMSLVQQVLTSIPVVQAFGAEERNRERYDALASDTARLAQRGGLLTAAFNGVNGTATTAGTALLLYVGAERVLSGALTLGSLLVFLAYLRSVYGAAVSLLRTYGTLKGLEASIDRVLEVLDAGEEVREAPDACPLPPSPSAGAHVRLEGVSFGYDPQRPILHRLTLEALPGETVALVGRTGAGKSTLVSLLPRFFDPQEGRVLLNGADLRDLRLRDVRAAVALVLQEPFLLPLSVAENLAYGKPGATREEIEAAARAANADGFIRRLPQGYDTVLGERGATLSGGEKQRLSIARALLKDAPVLILDEPTSALDVETEGQVLEALGRLMAGRTTFLIAHRLSTVQGADRVVVLEDGEIVEQGPPQELLSRDGAFRHFNLIAGHSSGQGAAALPLPTEGQEALA